MKPSRFAILCAVLVLVACGGETKKATGGKADGEILPASVDDSMLPYDTVRSQAPLAPGGEGGDAAKDKHGVKPAEKKEVSAKPDAEPEPEPSKAAEPAE